jgi:hypothetical protein
VPTNNIYRAVNEECPPDRVSKSFNDIAFPSAGIQFFSNPFGVVGATELSADHPCFSPDPAGMFTAVDASLSILFGRDGSQMRPWQGSYPIGERQRGGAAANDVAGLARTEHEVHVWRSKFPFPQRFFPATKHNGYFINIRLL